MKACWIDFDWRTLVCEMKAQDKTQKGIPKNWRLREDRNPNLIAGGPRFKSCYPKTVRSNVM